MRLFVDLDRLILVNDLGSPFPIRDNCIAYTRGDTLVMRIQFCVLGAAVAQELDSPVLSFAAKEPGNFAGDPVLGTSHSTKSGSGSTSIYTVAPTLDPEFDPEPLDTLLGTGSPFVDLAAELQIDDGGVLSTVQFQLRVRNDYIKTASIGDNVLTDSLGNPLTDREGNILTEKP